MARETSRNIQAIEASNNSLNDSIAVLQRQDISALNATEPGGGTMIGMASVELVAANGPRFIEISNTAVAGTAFFQRNTDAIVDKGTALPPGDSKIIPLADGDSLNAIGSTGNVKLSFQVYGV